MILGSHWEDRQSLELCLSLKGDCDSKLFLALFLLLYHERNGVFLHPCVLLMENCHRLKWCGLASWNTTFKSIRQTKFFLCVSWCLQFFVKVMESILPSDPAKKLKWSISIATCPLRGPAPLVSNCSLFVFSLQCQHGVGHNGLFLWNQAEQRKVIYHHSVKRVPSPLCYSTQHPNVTWSWVQDWHTSS